MTLNTPENFDIVNMLKTDTFGTLSTGCNNRIIEKVKRDLHLTNKRCLL